MPSGLTIVKPALEPSLLDALSIYSFHPMCSPFFSRIWRSVSSSSSYVFAIKYARIFALIMFLGLNSISCSPISIADFSSFNNMSLIGQALTFPWTALMHSFEAARYTIRPSSACGATRMGSFSMYFFISLKALSASLVHVKSFFSKHPFNVLKNGKDFSALLDRNLLRAASFSFKLCTSLMVLGRLRLVSA
ncbi:hypothetical protein Tco_0494952 [Tanacetum coccineum]